MVSSLFFLFISLLTHSIFTTTATLYVASSSVLLEEQPEKNQTETPSSSSLSFTLHTRSSIDRNQHHHDYESLTLARLARDSQRVASIITKLNLATSQTNESEMKPGVGTNSTYNTEDLTTPVVSGLSVGSGEYFASVGFGTPAKYYYLTIDTGSDITWLQCLPCYECYRQLGPIYDPSGSSSFKRLPCTQQCMSCQNGLCLYKVSYLDGSFTSGELVSETVSFGSSGSAPSVSIGCGHYNTGKFVGAAGLLGLGGGPLSFPSEIKATSFSYCLVDRDSSMTSTLDFNSAPPAYSITTPLIQNPASSYYVELTGISVGGQRLPIPASVFSRTGGAILDSGTTLTFLPSQAYNALRDAFTQKAVRLKPTDGFRQFDTCFDSPSRDDVPPVAFIFSRDKTLSLKAENCLIRVDSNGKFCLAFLPEDSVLLIGNVQQQGIRVGYHINQLFISFSPNSC